MLLISYYGLIILFKPIFLANEIIIDFWIKPFDICQKNPLLWEYIKRIYIITFCYCNIITNNYLYNLLRKIYLNKNSKNKHKILTDK